MSNAVRSAWWWQRIAALALGLLGALFPASVRALELSWSAPPECSARAAQRARIEQLLARQGLSASALVVVGTVTREESHYRLSLRIATPLHEAVRAVQLADCGAVDQATVALVEMALDPGLAAAALTKQAAPGGARADGAGAASKRAAAGATEQARRLSGKRGAPRPQVSAAAQASAAQGSAAASQGSASAAQGSAAASAAQGSAAGSAAQASAAQASAAASAAQASAVQASVAGSAAQALAAEPSAQGPASRDEGDSAPARAVVLPAAHDEAAAAAERERQRLARQRAEREELTRVDRAQPAAREAAGALPAEGVPSASYRSPSLTQRWGRMAALAGVWSAGLPEPQIDLGVRVGLGRGALYGELVADWMLPRSDGLEWDSPGKVRIRSLAVGLAGCAAFGAWADRVRLGPCARLSVLRSEGAVTQITEPREDRVIWLASTLSALLGVRLFSLLELSVEAGAGLPLSARPRFSVAGRGTAQEARLYALHAVLGLGVRWEQKRHDTSRNVSASPIGR